MTATARHPFEVIDPAACNPDTMAGRVGVVLPDRTSGLAALSAQPITVRSTGHSAFHGTPRYEVSGIAVSGPLAGRPITAIAESADFELYPAPLSVRECGDVLCDHPAGCWVVTDQRGESTHGHDGLIGALNAAVARCPDCAGTDLDGPDFEGFLDCLTCGAAWIPGRVPE